METDSQETYPAYLDHFSSILAFGDDGLQAGELYNFEVNELFDTTLQYDCLYNFLDL
jgi:hypothetical protein